MRFKKAETIDGERIAVNSEESGRQNDRMGSEYQTRIRADGYPKSGWYRALKKSCLRDPIKGFQAKERG